MPIARMQNAIFSGPGSPEGVLVADRGAVYWRSDGGAGTTQYNKESGDGTDTGWVAIASSGGPATQLDANGTVLDVDAIADGQFLVRSGTTVVGSAGGGGPATQLDANGTVLDVNVIADGDILRRTGTTCVGATCTAAGYALLDDADAAAQRTTLGLVAIASSGSASDLGTGTLPIARIADGDVTLAKLANLATDRIIGRATAGAGVPEALTCTAAGRALLDDADAAAQRTTLGLATIASSGSAADLSAGILPDARMPNLTGDVTTIEGAVATTIANDAVTNAKLANMAANSIKLNNTGGAADPIDGTAAQATAMLDTFTSGAKGLVPASGGGTTNFLRADGTFALPPSASGCGLTRISGASGAAGADLTWQRLSANATANATTTLATVMTTTDLAAGTYDFEYMVVYQSSATGTGVQLVVDYSGTSGAFVCTWIFTSTGGAAATGVADQDTATIAGQLVEGKSTRTKGVNPSASAGVDTVNANMLAIVKGTIVVTGVGELRLRHASETAASTQVMADTTLKLCKVA